MAAPAGRQHPAWSTGTFALASSALVQLFLLLWPAMASAQSVPPATEDAESTGLDFFRPPPNLFQLQHEYRTTPGSST
jgi:hypothetical protein